MQSSRPVADRTILRLQGEDWQRFLGDLVTNSLAGLDAGAVYAALLSPQGKYLFDFMLIGAERGVLLDIQSARAAALIQRLSMYRLRAKVSIEATSMQVAQVFGRCPDFGGNAIVVADPRDNALGWRVYGDDVASLLTGIPAAGAGLWERLRVTHVVPETGIELIPDDSYILEAGFERLHGVDFRKGCYVGQEVTARMKHKTELKKGLVQVSLAGTAVPGTEIMSDGKPAGTLFTVSDGLGLAHLRFDRAEGKMRAGNAVVTRVQSP